MSTTNLSDDFSTAKRVAALLACVDDEPDCTVTLTVPQWRRVQKRQRRLGLHVWVDPAATTDHDRATIAR